MDRTATPNRRTGNVEQGFERSRLSEEVLAAAYERLVPLVCRWAGFPREDSPTRLVAWQPRQARRAS
jgi:hypothetical protein